MINRSILITRDDHKRLTNHLDMFIASREPAFDRQYLMELRYALSRARIVDRLPEKPQVITLGTTVRVLNLFNNEELVYTLVMPEDADLERGRLSVTDPLGAALLGYREGDTIEFTPFRSRLAIKVMEIIDHPVSVVAGPDKMLIPMLYSRVTGCPSDLIEFYVSLFKGQREAQVMPHHLGNLDLPPTEFRQSMEMFLDQLGEQNECPVMLIEWQGHDNMTRLMALLHERKQEALFVKSGGAQPIRRVTALISGSSQSLQNLKIASLIARRLGAEAGAVRVVNPAWVGLDGEAAAKAEYLQRIKAATEARLGRAGLQMPVRILFGDNVLDEVVQAAQPTDMLILGCPNDLLIHNGFMESLAGGILRRFAGTVLLRLPGRQNGKASNLADIFWEATIVRDLVAPNKWEAIGRLLEALTNAGQVPRERHQQILRRSRCGSWTAALMSVAGWPCRTPPSMTSAAWWAAWASAARGSSMRRVKNPFTSCSCSFLRAGTTPNTTRSRLVSPGS
jgi:regulator of nucleoside diphosphate kinase